MTNEKLTFTVDEMAAALGISRPVAYELSFDNGQPTHTAILHDLHANSITKCNLERVVKYEQGRSNQTH